MLESLPISRGVLESYRIGCRYQNRPGLVGGHQMRRKGQSLEFHDYRPYIAGDDIRHVDWRASARHGGANDLMVKTFAAEERLTIIISVDTRETMGYPEYLPKGRVAAWLAEAISWITLRSEDRVVLHRLFGKGGSSGVQELYGVGGLASIRRVLNRFWNAGTPTDTVNLGVLERYLRPAVVWIIVSDYYFDMNGEGKKLARRIAEAQDGMRWVILLDTDSWPYERQYLGEGPRKIEGPGMQEPDHPFEIDSSSLRDVEEKIIRHKQAIFDHIGRGAFDLSNWKWPMEEEPDPAEFFEDRFGRDSVLRRLFMRENENR
jgi:hypothetical protein